MSAPSKIAVLGAGAWGTALALQQSRRHQVSLWTRSAAHAAAMQQARSNGHYLADFPFNRNLTVTHDLVDAVEAADLIVSVVPSAGFRETLGALAQLGGNAPLVWASKGLEPHTARLPCEVAHEVLGTTRAWGALSGPSFAVELARGLPTAITLAMCDGARATEIGAMLHGGNLRVYTSDDVIGVSVGGALKNVMAIAAGISDGMAFGSNARAALITRGLAEMTRFGMALGARQETFMGLTGIGDLILTCTGDYSRNRDVGLRLARGQTLTVILQQLGHVAEGVHTAGEVIRRAAGLGVEMPITEEVHQVLMHDRAARVAVENLLGRKQKPEQV